MTPEDLSSRLVNEINRGGLCYIVPDFTTLDVDILKKEEHIGVVWTRPNEPKMIYGFTKKDSNSYWGAVMSIVDGSEPQKIGNTVVINSFVYKLIDVIKELLEKPMDMKEVAF
jgi:hypothetical protein